ncbi:NAD(P)/FAD-dependent oxidoreductase [Kitasatospora sp. NPDC058263]
MTGVAELSGTDQVVVVGAGLAGAHCAAGLRQGGWRGRIVVVGEEPHTPYDRPPLSKEVLLGKADATPLDLDLAQLGVELLTGRRATGLTPGVLRTDGGDLPYDALVIATGAAPRALPGAERAHLLHTLDDALALRALLRPGLRLVLVGAGWIGARPATGWLAGSGVALDAAGAILVDERLRTTLPGVHAAGDCVSYPSARAGARLTVQHWDHALQSGAAAAAAVLGAEVAYDPVPYFWSEQFGRTVQYAGRHGEGDELLWRGSPQDPSWAVLWLRDGVLRALLTVDRPRDLTQGRRLVERAAVLDPVRAADPAVALKSAVAG